MKESVLKDKKYSAFHFSLFTIHCSLKKIDKTAYWKHQSKNYNLTSKHQNTELLSYMITYI